MGPLSAPRAIAFDLDGTLIDSRRDIVAACNYALGRAGRPPLDDAVIATFVGDGARALMARALGLPADAPAVDGGLDDFVRYYAQYPVVHTGWMPNAVAALDALRALPLAVITNKTRAVARTILDALGAAGRFAALYGGGDGPLKPNPEPLFAVARTLGVRAEDLWIVGDGAQDIGAGRAAGCVTVGVLGGFHDEARLRAAGPDHIVSSLAELPALVRESGGSLQRRRPS